MPCHSETLRLAVASNFIESAHILAREFESISKHEIQISSGSSGKLYHQIINGAPYDVFLSADTQKPQFLASKGVALESSRQTYALGQLAIWFKQCPDEPSLTKLTDKSIRKIALANPKLAPYGHATQSLLKNNQIWAILKSKLIYPENISQVAQMVKLGVVDAAFIAGSHNTKLESEKAPSAASCSQLLNPKEYPRIAQDLVLLKQSKNNIAAKEFITFIASPKGQDLIKNMGYLLP